MKHQSTRTVVIVLLAVVLSAYATPPTVETPPTVPLPSIPGTALAEEGQRADTPPAAAALAPTAQLTATSSPPIPATPASRTGAADQWLGKPDEREGLFDSYVQTIRDGHTLTEYGWKELGTTWERELQRAKQRFLAADTKADVYYALLSLQRSMHDEHSRLAANWLVPPAGRMALPFSLEPRGDSRESAQYVVTVSATPAIKPGYVLQSYQGKSPAQLEYDYLEWLSGTSPERLKADLARELTYHSGAANSPAPDPGPVRVGFVDPDRGSEIEVTVKWASVRAAPEPVRDDYEHFARDFRGLNYDVYKDPANDALVLRSHSFNYSFSEAALKNALEQASFPVPLDPKRYQPGQLEAADAANLAAYLNRQSAANLLMDVRTNPGGNVNLQLLAILAAKPFMGPSRSFAYSPLVRTDPEFREEMLFFTDRYMRQIILDQIAGDPGALVSRPFPWNCRSSACDRQEAAQQPNRGVRKFNVAVLSGAYCASACDNFVALVKDNDIGKVIGLPSNGCATPYLANRDFLLKDGSKFSIVLPAGYALRVNGESLEGNPAQVEYYLWPEDNYLEKMIQYLRKQGFFR